MQQYSYNTPQILTDTIFTLYGGRTGTSTAPQREVAFALAEEQMTEYINAPLVPTTVTGTFFWRGRNPLELDYGWVISVQGVTINSPDYANGCGFDSATGCFLVRNAQYGYLDVSYLINCGGCGAVVGAPPYNIQVAYTAGLSTGSYTSPAMLSALVMAAQINLNEIDVSLSNESTADIGITNFTNQRYSEARMKLGNTAFGNSPMANRIARLARRFRARPAIGLH